ncbi:unnamed protein product [Merluccius merluccius]
MTTSCFHLGVVRALRSSSHIAAAVRRRGSSSPVSHLLVSGLRLTSHISPLSSGPETDLLPRYLSTTSEE